MFQSYYILCNGLFIASVMFQSVLLILHIITYKWCPARFGLIIRIQEYVKQRPGSSPHEDHQGADDTHWEYTVEDVKDRLSAVL